MCAGRKREYFYEVIGLRLPTVGEQISELVDFLGVDIFRFRELGKKLSPICR
jgi:hypothetical protein